MTILKTNLLTRALISTLALCSLLLVLVSSSPPQLMSWGEDTPSDVASCYLNSTLSLTFDDGPSPYTSDLLTTLKELRIKATFFILGKEALLFPETLKQAYQDGHHIALHTYSHVNLLAVGQSIIVAEINAAAEAVANIIGVYPTFFRPPFGSLTKREYYLLQRMGFTVTMWDIDTKDWDNGTDPYFGFHTFLHADIINHNLPENYHFPPEQKSRGYLSLQHDNRKHSVSREKITQIYNLARSRGFTFATVSECAIPKLNVKPYRSRKELSPAQMLLYNDKLDVDAVKAAREGKQYQRPSKIPESTDEEKLLIQDQFYKAARDEMKDILLLEMQKVEDGKKEEERRKTAEERKKSRKTAKESLSRTSAIIKESSFLSTKSQSLHDQNMPVGKSKQLQEMTGIRKNAVEKLYVSSFELTFMWIPLIAMIALAVGWRKLRWVRVGSFLFGRGRLSGSPIRSLPKYEEVSLKL